MGQYHLPINVSKKQFIDPHKFDDGLKLLEFGASGDGTMLALAVLLSDSNGRGGGDLHSSSPIIGSWAGDQIVIAGDYGDNGKWGVGDDVNLYHVARDSYEDVSAQVMAAIMDDVYQLQEYAERYGRGYDNPFTKCVEEALLLNEQARVAWLPACEKVKSKKDPAHST